MLHGGHVKAVAAVAMSFAAAVGISTLAYPRVFRIACERAFDFVDEDSSGELDTSEIMTAVLMLYSHLNKRLPWEDPPTKAQVQQLMEQADVDQNGRLNKEEFVNFCNNFLKGGENFFKRLSTGITRDVGTIPAVAKGAKVALKATAIGAALPESVVAGLVSTTTKLVTGK